MATDRGYALPGCVVEPGVLDPQKLDDLLSRVAYGDEAAFAEVYDQVAGLVYSLAFAITENAARSEEVTADVLAEVWRTAARYSPAAGSVPAWVMTMTQLRAKRSAPAPGRRRRPARSSPVGASS
jgi:RNA polymerase sigma-70 factor, ECF subfamily